MNNKKTTKFEIVTPERVVLKCEVLQATIPTVEGEITVLPNHIPLVSLLKPGVIEIKKDDSDDTEIIAVSGGFVEVLKNKIVILADTAEKANELDEERITEAKKNAEELKRKTINQDAVDFASAVTRIEIETARARAIKKWKRIKK